MGSVCSFSERFWTRDDLESLAFVLLLYLLRGDRPWLTRSCFCSSATIVVRIPQIRSGRRCYHHGTGPDFLRDFPPFLLDYARHLAFDEPIHSEVEITRNVSPGKIFIHGFGYRRDVPSRNGDKVYGRDSINACPTARQKTEIKLDQGACYETFLRFPNRSCPERKEVMEDCMEDLFIVRSRAGMINR